MSEPEEAPVTPLGWLCRDFLPSHVWEIPVARAGLLGKEFREQDACLSARPPHSTEDLKWVDIF